LNQHQKIIPTPPKAIGLGKALFNRFDNLGLIPFISRHESKHQKKTLLGLLSDRANEISPEKYTVIGNELRNPNTRLADLFSKAKEGIQTSKEASEQPNKLGIVTEFGFDTLYQCTRYG
jgi:hypothetical protein